jgi:hypothetical protein
LAWSPTKVGVASFFAYPFDDIAGEREPAGIGQVPGGLLAEVAAAVRASAANFAEISAGTLSTRVGL